jgi:hypothetical protein
VELSENENKERIERLARQVIRVVEEYQKGRAIKGRKATDRTVGAKI